MELRENLRWYERLTSASAPIDAPPPNRFAGWVWSHPALAVVTAVGLQLVSIYLTTCGGFGTDNRALVPLLFAFMAMFSPLLFLVVRNTRRRFGWRLAVAVEWITVALFLAWSWGAYFAFQVACSP
jgi:hypothetical protein